MHGILTLEPDPTNRAEFFLGCRIFACNPLSLPVVICHYSHLEPSGGRHRLSALLIPGNHLPRIALLRLEWRPSVDNIERLGRQDLAGVPCRRTACTEVFSFGDDQNFIRGLGPVRSLCIAEPGKDWLWRVEAERREERIRTKMNGRCVCSGCKESNAE